MKKSIIFYEFLVVPMIFVVLAAFIRIGTIYFNSGIAHLLFPTNNSFIQMIKMFVTSMIVLIIIEYFIKDELPNNYLLSRLLSMIVMVITYFLLRQFFTLIDEEYIFLLVIFSIYCGQVICYLLQQSKKYKYDTIYCLVVLIMTIAYFVINN